MKWFSTISNRSDWLACPVCSRTAWLLWCSTSLVFSKRSSILLRRQVSVKATRAKPSRNPCLRSLTRGSRLRALFFSRSLPFAAEVDSDESSPRCSHERVHPRRIVLRSSSPRWRSPRRKAKNTTVTETRLSEHSIEKLEGMLRSVSPVPALCLLKLDDNLSNPACLCR